MVKFPIDKYLAQDYRNTLRTSDAPQYLDTETPLIPVVDVQKGFPKPNSKQTLRYATVKFTTTAGYVQIVTKTANTRIYFIGIKSVNGAAILHEVLLFDGTGNYPTVNADTLYTDEAGFIDRLTLPATVGAQYITPNPLPIELKYGLRIYGGVASGNATNIITYIEEVIN